MSTEINENIEEVELEPTTESGSSLPRRGMFAAAAGGFAAVLAAVTAQRSDRSVVRGTAAAATGTSGRQTERRATPAVAPSQAVPDGDLDIAAVAASLEVLAVNTYGAALDAAGAGSLGDVPPAVGEFVTVVQGQHQEALDAWNGVLTGAGRPAVTEPPADLAAQVNEMFGMVTDVVGAAQLALTLESIAAATYLSALGSLQSEAGIALAGSIQPIDRQHMAVLTFVLGMYPVPEVFAPVDMAYTPGQPMQMPTVPATR